MNSHHFLLVDFKIKGLSPAKNGMLTIWPDETGSDGFFVAKLKKGSV